jgi:hypothetical protein
MIPFGFIQVTVQTGGVPQRGNPGQQIVQIVGSIPCQTLYIPKACSLPMLRSLRCASRYTLVCVVVILKESYRVNRRFNSICLLPLYQAFNYLEPPVADRDIAGEILTRYGSYFRTVRVSTKLWRRSSWEKIKHLLLPLLTERVTSLGIYFDDEGKSSRLSPRALINDVMNVLQAGRVKSFGIYSNSAFSSNLDDFTPAGASALLQQITLCPSLSQLNSLEIATERMDESLYDALRTQIGKLRSLTIRSAFQEDLEPVWSIARREKWLSCHNLTTLQLVQCAGVATPHVPYVIQSFPSLRTLILASCGGRGVPWVPQREKGWSFTKDSVWQDRPPLEMFHLERVFYWEISTLGVIHTSKLIIADVIEGKLIDSFRDEELFPHLRTLKIEHQDIDPDLEVICAKRGIILEPDALRLLHDD